MAPRRPAKLRPPPGEPPQNVYYDSQGRRERSSGGERRREHGSVPDALQEELLRRYESSSDRGAVEAHDQHRPQSSRTHHNPQRGHGGGRVNERSAKDGGQFAEQERDYREQRTNSAAGSIHDYAQSHYRSRSSRNGHHKHQRPGHEADKCGQRPDTSDVSSTDDSTTKRHVDSRCDDEQRGQSGAGRDSQTSRKGSRQRQHGFHDQHNNVHSAGGSHRTSRSNSCWDERRASQPRSLYGSSGSAGKDRHQDGHCNKPTRASRRHRNHDDDEQLHCLNTPQQDASHSHSDRSTGAKKGSSNQHNEHRQRSHRTRTEEGERKPTTVADHGDETLQPSSSLPSTQKPAFSAAAAAVANDGGSVCGAVHNPESDSRNGETAKAQKPIRGARPGEAILTRAEVLDPTVILPNGMSNQQLRAILCRPLKTSSGQVLQCFIERSRASMGTTSAFMLPIAMPTLSLTPIYSLYVEMPDGTVRLLMAARKVLKSKTPHYIISTRRDDLFVSRDKRSPDTYLGKLRAGEGDTADYTLYDAGDNPRTALGSTWSAGERLNNMNNTGDLCRDDEHRMSPAGSAAQESCGIHTGSEHSLDSSRHRQTSGASIQGIRRELCVVHYAFDKRAQIAGKAKADFCRRMEVAVPQVRQRVIHQPTHQQSSEASATSEVGQGWEDDMSVWRPVEVADSMAAQFRHVRRKGGQNFLVSDRMLVLHQRESRYDPLSSCLVDFKGRASTASVRNFQLIMSTPTHNATRARLSLAAVETATPGSPNAQPALGQAAEGAGAAVVEADSVCNAVVLQLGKISANCYNMDLQAPLSILQAFAICLSRFDTSAQF
ncbi:tubby C-terminal-like domain-containing protein [Tribonema minus]|uniref:Tubby C-terminal-like domain-containing protein n=1 Tax=Tribonema minus TaxID=303371 RepID=A0A836C912_9STRA|nr:tubby C-terminal-like domain-containing protein [Tribonema minus]